jgi:hypothetical protein
VQILPNGRAVPSFEAGNLPVTSPCLYNSSCPTFYAVDGARVRRMGRDDNCKRQLGLYTRR